MGQTQTDHITQMKTITKYNLCLIQWKPPLVNSQADLVEQMIIVTQSNLYSKLINGGASSVRQTKLSIDVSDNQRLCNRS